MEGWRGRVDDDGDTDARRWHQTVRPVQPASPAGVAVLGFACDEGVRRNGGRTGAAQGPAALRAALSNLPVLDDAPLYDAGDVACRDGDLEQAQARFGERLAGVLDAGHLAVGLGGGHEIAFASYQGLVRHLGARRPRVAIVNLDAHFDLRDQPRASSGTPFLQALRHADDIGLPLDYLCLGVSASANTRRLFATAERHGVRHRRDDELTLSTLEHRIAELRDWLQPVEHVYLTLCLDVLPGPVAPGVSAPSARGVPLEVLEPLLDAVAATGKVALFDVAELSPPFDRDQATARVAARLVHRIAGAVIARRREVPPRRTPGRACLNP